MGTEKKNAEMKKRALNSPPLGNRLKKRPKISLLQQHKTGKKGKEGEKERKRFFAPFFKRPKKKKNFF